MAEFNDTFRYGGTGRGAYTLQSSSAGQVPVVAKGVSGQTANLLEAQQSDGTVVFSVDNSGNVTWTGSTIIVVDETITGNLSVGGTTTLTGATSLSTMTSSVCRRRSSTTFWAIAPATAAMGPTPARLPASLMAVTIPGVGPFTAHGERVSINSGYCWI